MTRSQKQKKNKKVRCLGIMNGTSLDGADFILVDIDLVSLSCVYQDKKSFSFSKSLRAKLYLAATHQLKVDELALLHHELGRYYANCFKKLNREFKKSEIIGLHGQTVFHKGKVASLQIGEASYLAAESKAIVVSDFRVGDIALNGQGAPIAGFFHEKIFGQKAKTVSVHNLGGISNISLLVNGKLEQCYDTGPANMLLDYCIQKYTKNKMQFDANGDLARKGQAHQGIVLKMLKHNFFKIKPPKSCGREEFGEHFFKKFSKNLEILPIEDQLATLTEFVACTISKAYTKWSKKLPTEIIFCGGGAKNKFLLDSIQNKLPKNIKIKTTEAYQWSVESIEGAAFALLAAARVTNTNSSIAKCTGAKRSTSLGKVVCI